MGNVNCFRCKPLAEGDQFKKIEMIGERNQRIRTELTASVSIGSPSTAVGNPCPFKVGSEPCGPYRSGSDQYFITSCGPVVTGVLAQGDPILCMAATASYGRARYTAAYAQRLPQKRR